MFKNIRQDLKAYGCDWDAQGFWVMPVYRFGRWRYGVRPALLRKCFSLIYKFLFKLMRTCEVGIGRNFVIDYFGGVVISDYARFGDDCHIRNGVVVGLKNVDEPSALVIGNNVIIGVNAVVIRDVPDNSIAVGVPAVIEPRGNTDA